jgi:hypothetical protein
MALTTTITVGRLLARNELITTAKLNAMVRGIVINVTGSVGTSDLTAGAVTAAKTSVDAFWYAAATSTGAVYGVSYTPAVSGYADGQWFKFKTDIASKAAAQFNAGPGALPLYYSGSPVGAGDFTANQDVIVSYNSSLNSGGGGFEVMSPLGARPVTADYLPASAQRGGQRGLVPDTKAGQQAYVLFAGGWADPTAQFTALVQQLAGANVILNQFLLGQH